MKKIINIKYLAFYISVFGVMSCNSLLDEVPDNRAEIDSSEKIKELLVGAYPDALYFLQVEAMSDNADDKINFTDIDRLNDFAYHWKDNFEETRDTPTYYWREAYAAIAVANQALKSIEELGETKDLQPFKGEALLARAYAHFTLGVLWAKPYNSLTAHTDMAVPYADKVETKLLVHYPRLSVKDFYDAIRKDIEEGIPLIDNSVYLRPKFHFTKEAAHAFASRFYLMKGDWEKVLYHTNKVLQPLAGNVKNYLRNINQIAPLTYSQKGQRYSSVNEPANLLVVGASSRTSRNFAVTKYGLTQDLQSKIYSRDKHPLGLRWAYSFYGGELYQNRPKFVEYFKYTNISAGYGYAYTMATLLSYDEVLLNRAEANLMLKNYDKVIEDINLFLPNKTRGTVTPITEAIMDTKYTGRGTEFSPNYNLETKQQEWLQCLVDLRQVEFIHEGIRWFDIKRLGMKVVHRSGNNTFELLKNDPRREFQIPQDAISQGMTPNPR